MLSLLLPPQLLLFMLSPLVKYLVRNPPPVEPSRRRRGPQNDLESVSVVPK